MHSKIIPKGASVSYRVMYQKQLLYSLGNTGVRGKGPNFQGSCFSVISRHPKIAVETIRSSTFSTTVDFEGWKHICKASRSCRRWWSRGVARQLFPTIAPHEGVQVTTMVVVTGCYIEPGLLCLLWHQRDSCTRCYINDIILSFRRPLCLIEWRVRDHNRLSVISIYTGWPIKNVPELCEPDNDLI